MLWCSASSSRCIRSGRRRSHLRCPNNRNDFGPRNKCDAFIRVLAETSRIEGKSSYQILRSKHLPIDFKVHNGSCKLDGEVRQTQNEKFVNLFINQMTALKIESAIVELFEFFDKATAMKRVPYVKLNESELAALGSSFNLEKDTKFVQMILREWSSMNYYNNYCLPFNSKAGLNFQEANLRH